MIKQPSSIQPENWPDGLAYYPHWLAENLADNLFNELMQQVNWSSPEITLFGQKHRIPRKQGFLGEAGVLYTYSGLTNVADGWPDSVKLIADTITEQTGIRFNSCLLNWYQGGDHGMGWHTDSEAELKRPLRLAVLTLGESRRFLLRQKRNSGDRITLAPGNGSLLVLQDKLLTEWQHAVPKTKKNVNDRISLTFRQVINSKESV